MRRRAASSPQLKSAVTIKDVAARAGVSTATVSRVLAGQNGVGKRVREQVSEAAQQLAYQPNRLARDLRVGSRKVVGVVIPDLQNPFLTSVVHGIEAVLCREGYSLLLGHSDSLTEREQTQLAVFRAEGVAGLILIPNNGADADYKPLRAWNIPIVAADRTPQGLQVDLVRTNNQEAMREATEHLLSHGYKEIGFINGPPDISVAQERLAGYLEAIRKAGLTPRESLIIHSDFHQDGGHAAMEQLLNLTKRPRAVVIANNLMTLGALQAIHERALRIPDEVAVLGFDDMPWATSLRPPLTAVAQPAEEIGRAAAQLLLERLVEPTRMARQVILPATLIIRTSCGTHPLPKESSVPSNQMIAIKN
ncbi:MAG TPA: LacI family DNA-binding transcriptional regulator [Verrucomicrobiae bacterium]|nr:LacI family DNA-binding transcriptional regulator [Verrucomicrobiae bacterium]